MKDIVIIAGPTAVGKTDLSIFLAKKIDGEIISADSMQVYKGMDIGTGKITTGEMMGIKHHLIDILDPSEDFNIALFVKLAREAIADIRSRGKMPIIVGGTGFYIQALLKDVNFEDEEDTSYRESLYKILEEKGAEYVHDMLKDIDEVSFNEIPVNNSKRVIRALEYYHFHGRPISELNKQQRETASPYNFAYFVLTLERSALYERINRRVDAMIAGGLAEEVQGLVAGGMPEQCPAMLAIGYRQMLPYLHGECTLAEAGEQIKLETRPFAKRQMTWFRREADAILLPKDNAYTEELLSEMLRVLREKEIITGV